MSLIIDANMRLFADKMHINSSRMLNEYGLQQVEEIIQQEEAQGNRKAHAPGLELYENPERLIEVFKLADIDNKFDIINSMDEKMRQELLPMIEHEDLAMGLYFFTQEKLLLMLAEVDIKELVNVIKEAFPLEQIVMMFNQDDLSGFFMHKDLNKNDVIENLKILPHEVMIKFVESMTGMPADQTNPMDLISALETMPTEQYQKIMAAIDPMVQRQLTFQLTKGEPDYLQLFNNMSYLYMLNTMMKPEMVKPMIALETNTIIDMVSQLPGEFLSIVAAQIDTDDFAKYILRGHTNVLDAAKLI